MLRALKNPVSSCPSTVQVLDYHGSRPATAVADGSHAEPGLVLLQHVEQSDNDATAACAEGMPERDRTTEDVDPDFFM